jgi:hypothetical protein
MIHGWAGRLRLRGTMSEAKPSRNMLQGIMFIMYPGGDENDWLPL